MVTRTGGRRLSGTDPSALASQLIWHVAGPSPDQQQWRTALADWVGITDTPVTTKQAIADRLGISDTAVGRRISRVAAAGQQIWLTPAQRRAVTTLTSTDPTQRRMQRRIAGMFGLAIHSVPAARLP